MQGSEILSSFLKIDFLDEGKVDVFEGRSRDFCENSRLGPARLGRYGRKKCVFSLGTPRSGRDVSRIEERMQKFVGGDF